MRLITNTRPNSHSKLPTWKRLARGFSLGLLCVISTALSPQYLVAQEANVYYGGFSYLGSHAFIEDNYRFTSKINELVDGVSVFDRALTEHINPQNFSHINLVTTGLADQSDEFSLSMTLALESELTSVEQIGEDFKLLIQLSFQVLFFDYGDMSIVASYPISLQFNDVLQEYPSDASIEHRYRDLYFGDLDINVFRLFYDKLREISVKKKYAHRIQVQTASIAPQVLDLAPDNSNHARLEQWIGQSFTQALSSNQNISMLPFVKGHAIGNKLAGRYASGDIYMLEIPESDYAIDVYLSDLKKKKYSEKTAGTSWIYAARARFRIYETLTGDTFFEESLFNGATKLVPASQMSIDEWPAYRESFLVLVDKFTKVIGSPNKRWLKKHAGRVDNYKGLLKVQEVISSCI